jgi:type II restriction enzyme
MSISKKQSENVEIALKTALKNKFLNYSPEPAYMPFHTRLLGKDRLALYSFIQSLNTNFGTTIYEPVAVSLANSRFKIAKTQQIAGELISEKAQYVIQKIMDDLTAADYGPDKPSEIEKIREVCRVGQMRKVKPTKVDVLLQDIKTAKPNKGGFIEFKRTLLVWTACVLASNPDAKIQTYIAIPYNPYFPKPYSRWTMAGMLDLKNELKVADEFWDFLGGEGTFDELLNCFERVGIELRGEIDEYFSRFKNK